MRICSLLHSLSVFSDIKIRNKAAESYSLFYCFVLMMEVFCSKDIAVSFLRYCGFVLTTLLLIRKQFTFGSNQQSYKLAFRLLRGRTGLR